VFDDLVKATMVPQRNQVAKTMKDQRASKIRGVCDPGILGSLMPLGSWNSRITTKKPPGSQKPKIDSKSFSRIAEASTEKSVLI